MSAIVPGLLTGLSLIVAIGAQNAFVLRQGLAGRFVVPVVAVCALSDLALIAAGVAGLGALVQAHPAVLTAISLIGAVFLLSYAALAARRALRPGELTAAGTAVTGLAGAITAALALTWLNPHVYLDTVVLLGSVAARHGDTGRWWFAAGAGLASIGWFGALGFGSRLLRGFFASRRSWRILDLIIAVIMLALGITLLLSTFR